MRAFKHDDDVRSALQGQGVNADAAMARVQAMSDAGQGRLSKAICRTHASPSSKSKYRLA